MPRPVVRRLLALLLVVHGAAHAVKLPLETFSLQIEVADEPLPYKVSARMEPQALKQWNSASAAAEGRLPAQRLLRHFREGFEARLQVQVDGYLVSMSPTGPKVPVLTLKVTQAGWYCTDRPWRCSANLQLRGRLALPGEEPVWTDDVYLGDIDPAGSPETANLDRLAISLLDRLRVADVLRRPPYQPNF